MWLFAQMTAVARGRSRDVCAHSQQPRCFHRDNRVSKSASIDAGCPEISVLSSAFVSRFVNNSSNPLFRRMCSRCASLCHVKLTKYVSLAALCVSAMHSSCNASDPSQYSAARARTGTVTHTAGSCCAGLSRVPLHTTQSYWIL